VRQLTCFPSGLAYDRKACLLDYKKADRLTDMPVDPQAVMSDCREVIRLGCRKAVKPLGHPPGQTAAFIACQTAERQVWIPP
jgi:hypothetical protein